MEKLTDLEYLRLNKLKKFWYKFRLFILAIPLFFKNIGLKIADKCKKAWLFVKNQFIDIYKTFKEGDWKTRTSFFVMGFGSIARGQWLRGVLFLLFELVFIIYMIFWGGFWLSKFPTLGTVQPGEKYDKILDTYVRVDGDNSFKILLYGLLTIIFIIGFIYTWRLNVKQNKISEEIIKSGKKIKSSKEDLKSMLDDQFHKTLLALPVLGITVFTVIPIIFMILVVLFSAWRIH